MKSITIDLDVYNYLVTKGLGEGESASTILRRELTRTVEIDDDLYNYILSLAADIGESASSILRRSLQLTPPGPGGGPVNPPSGTVIVFRIKLGTGAGAWNSREEMVVGVVGQTLRIVNDDSVPHRPHTSGAPFPHASTDIAPGASADFVLATPLNLATAGQSPIYDHNHSQAAQFWITVTPS